MFGIKLGGGSKSSTSTSSTTNNFNDNRNVLGEGSSMLSGFARQTIDSSDSHDTTLSSWSQDIDSHDTSLSSYSQDLSSHDTTSWSSSNSNSGNTTSSASWAQTQNSNNSTTANNTTNSWTGTDAGAVDMVGRMSQMASDVSTRQVETVADIAAMGFGTVESMGGAATEMFGTQAQSWLHTVDVQRDVLGQVATQQASTWGDTLAASKGLIGELLSSASGLAGQAVGLAQTAVKSYQPTPNANASAAAGTSRAMLWALAAVVVVVVVARK
ncbi:MAG: hypothetical protein RIQ53_2838 [Pseudomonadota bacterium]|jgi:hypothetical protein